MLITVRQTLENRYCIEVQPGQDGMGVVYRAAGLRFKQWIGQVLDALAYLHEQNVIHCDVKPSNVKITPGQAMHRRSSTERGALTPAATCVLGGGDVVRAADRASDLVEQWRQ